MTIATLDYKTIRQAVLRLPQQQRLQLLKDASLNQPDDEPSLTLNFDFEATRKVIQHAFAETGDFTDPEREDARYRHLMEKHGP